MNIDEKHIESLLNLFMQGETSLEQEQELRKFFANSPSVPENWAAYREMFAYFDAGMPKAKSKLNIARPLWTLVTAAAVLTIAIIVAPHLQRSHITDTTSTPQPITVDNNHITTNDTIKPEQSPATPLLVKQEHKTSKKKTIIATEHHVTHDSLDIEREQGEVELAQQELMADKYIIEQERQEILEEQYSGRVQAYQARQTFNNENPQFIQVVFK